MFLGFSLEVLHHYWLLVPGKLDRFWSYLIWRCWLRRLFFQICPFLGLEKCVFVCDMWEIRIQRCVSVSSCFWTYRWRDKIVWWFWIFFSWYHIFLFPFLCSRSVLFFTLVWGVLAARCQLVVWKVGRTQQMMFVDMPSAGAVFELIHLSFTYAEHE